MGSAGSGEGEGEGVALGPDSSDSSLVDTMTSSMMWMMDLPAVMVVVLTCVTWGVLRGLAP